MSRFVLCVDCVYQQDSSCVYLPPTPVHVLGQTMYMRPNCKEAVGCYSGKSLDDIDRTERRCSTCANWIDERCEEIDRDERVRVHTHSDFYCKKWKNKHETE